METFGDEETIQAMAKAYQDALQAALREANQPLPVDVIRPSQVTAFICPVCGHPEEFVTFAALHLMLEHNWHTTHLETLKAQLTAWGIPMADNIYGYLKQRADQLKVSNSVTK